MLTTTHDNEEIIERVAALDIGKAELMCCVRVPDGDHPGGRLQEVQAYPAMTRSVLGLADHLARLGVTRASWRPRPATGSRCCLLEAAGSGDLAGERQGRQAPARPAQDRQAGCGLAVQGRRAADAAAQLRPAAPDPAAAGPDPLPRRPGRRPHRGKTAGGEAGEDACIKLSAVVADIFGVSGRDMLAALVAGERDPKVLAQLARRSMRAKISVLEEAFTGHFTTHHAFLLRTMLGRVDAISADIAAVDERIAAQAAPLAGAVARLDDIPGISLASAHVILAEIGTDMTRFPTAGQLASWARLAPGISESAGKKKGKGSTGHGNAYLASVLGNAAAGAAKTDTFPGEKYRRIARRRGSKRAIVALGRSILVIAWHLLSDPEARFYDLGPGHHAARIDPERRKRTHIRELEALGYTVTLKPAA
jgi:hypothetical protein